MRLFNTILEDIRDKVKYYIKTFGCQMNVYDSQRIAHILQNMGHTAADAPEDADIIIFNTCHIREKAAEKLFSDLGRINLIKEDRQAAGKETLIGVVGCVVQAEDEQIAKRAPFVNFATGPLTYYRIPEILGKIAQQKNICLIDTEFTSESKFDHLPQNRAEGGCSYLAIQEGCNNFCTYCIVPYTRGVETSRPVEDVLKEARRLVETGTLEINLLGQNVNAYHGEDAAGRERDLAYLLRRLAEIDGLQRLRYTTSYPADVTTADNISKSSPNCATPTPNWASLPILSSVFPVKPIKILKPLSTWWNKSVTFRRFHLNTAAAPVPRPRHIPIRLTKKSNRSV